MPWSNNWNSSGGGGGSGVQSVLGIGPDDTGNVDFDTDNIPQGITNKFAQGDIFTPVIEPISGCSSPDNESGSYLGTKLVSGAIVDVATTFDIISGDGSISIVSIRGPGGNVASVELATVEVVQLDAIDGVGGIGNTGNTGSGWTNTIAPNTDPESLDSVLVTFEMALPDTAYRVYASWQYQIA